LIIFSDKNIQRPPPTKKAAEAALIEWLDV